MMASSLWGDSLESISFSLLIGAVGMAAIAYTIAQYKRGAKHQGDTAAVKISTGSGAKTESADDLNFANDSDDEVLERYNKFISEDYSKYVEDLDYNNSPTHANLISRIKLARQKAINKKILETLTVSDLKMEKIIESQQIARIYSLLHENEDAFGKMSIDDVKSQMTMYKENDS